MKSVPNNILKSFNQYLVYKLILKKEIDRVQVRLS